MAQKDERYQGVEKHSSGFKLLASMGWKEGEGLGAKRQGMKHHIKVKKSQDNAGIGLAEAARKAKDWTVGMAAYDLVLAKLKNVASPPATDTATPEMDTNKKRKQSKVSESEGCGDADAGQSAKSRKKLKSSKEASMPEQDMASAAEQILNRVADTAPLADSSSRAEVVAKVEKAIVSRASHLARFGRRRAGKNVQSYSGSDLAAILGENAVTTVSTKGARSEPEHAVRRLIVDVSDRISVIQDAPDDNQEQPDDAQKWWYSTFHRTGRLGSSAPPPVPESSSKPKIKITGFSEDDQTNLYNMAHETSGKGKQGLGIASRPKKVAGARWQGSKKRIEESSDDEEQAPAAEEQVQPAELPESEDCSEDTHVPNGQTQQHEEQEAGQQQSQTLLSQSAVVGKQTGSASALVKSARRVLKAVPGGQLRQKKLEKRVLDLLEVQRGSSERKEMRRALLAAMGGSTKVKMQDGLVSL